MKGKFGKISQINCLFAKAKSGKNCVSRIDIDKSKMVPPGDWLMAVLHSDSLGLFAEHSLAPLGEYLLALLLAAGFVLGDVGVVTRVDQAVGALEKPLLLRGQSGLL